MICKYCGNNNPGKARFCTSCGKLLGNICPGCGMDNVPEALYCTSCGTGLKDAGETARLVALARLKDEAAAARLFDMTKRRYMVTCRQILSKTSTSGEIEDVLQDAYIKIFSRLDSLNQPEKFVSWGERIVANTALDQVRKTAPILMDDETDLDAAGYEPMPESFLAARDPGQVIDERETSRLVAEIVEGLPEAQRLCVYLFYIKEMSVKDIAAQLGVSENTVKSRLKYGRSGIEKKVLLLEKQGTKLYGFAPLPFFIWLFRKMLADSETAVVISRGLRAAVLHAAASAGKQTAAGSIAAAGKTGAGKAAGRAAEKAAGRTAFRAAAGKAAGTAGAGSAAVGSAAAGSAAVGSAAAVKAIALLTAAAIAIGSGTALVSRLRRPDAAKAGQMVLDRYKTVLSDDGFWEKDIEFQRETGTMMIPHGLDPETIYMSYAWYDLNKDGIDELLISSGFDQDGDGISDAYVKEDDGLNSSYAGSPMHPECVYVYNGRKMVLAGQSEPRTYLHILNDGTIVESGSGGAASYGYTVTRIRNRGRKLEKNTYWQSGTPDHEEDTVYYLNDKEVTGDEYDRALESSLEGLDFDKDRLPSTVYNWTLFWPEEETAENGAAVRSGDQISDGENDASSAGNESAGTENAGTGSGTVTFSSILESTGFPYTGNRSEAAHYDWASQGGGGLGSSLNTGIISGQQLDLDGDGEDELAVVTLDPSEWPQFVRPKLGENVSPGITIFEKDKNGWREAASTREMTDLYLPYAAFWYPNWMVYTSSETGVLYLETNETAAITADPFTMHDIYRFTYDGAQLGVQRFSTDEMDGMPSEGYDEALGSIERDRRIAHIYVKDYYSESGESSGTFDRSRMPEDVEIMYADEGNVSW